MADKRDREGWLLLFKNSHTHACIDPPYLFLVLFFLFVLSLLSDYRILTGCCVHTRHYTLCMFEFSRMSEQTMCQTLGLRDANFKTLLARPSEKICADKNHHQNTTGITHNVVSKHKITCKMQVRGINWFQRQRQDYSITDVKEKLGLSALMQ